MSFEAVLERAQQFQSQTISENSASTYHYYLQLYEETMTFFQKDPYDIDINKMMVFIQHQKDRGLEYNSLKCCVSTLSYYFRSNELPNLTLDIKFINFQKGILRDMKTDRDPYKKEPWEPGFFDLYISKFPLNQISNTVFLFFMSISYYGFLRISELQNLCTSDIVIDTDLKRLRILIKYSKTDQFGKGEFVYIYDNDFDYSPYKLYNILKDYYKDKNLIVDRNGSSLRHHLKVVLKHIGVNPDHYSWHSFRKGGAHQASINGVQDSEIKKHGRWLSDAYVRYTQVEPEHAGSVISSKI